MTTELESRAGQTVSNQVEGDSTLWETHRGLRIGCKVLLGAAVVFTAWRYAWMSDDALITLRTSLNWAHGLGPQFNATERVVGYTHPLWMLLLTMLGGITDSWIFGTLYLSVLLAGTASVILVARTRNFWQLWTVGAVLLFANTFTEWSTSGLENPLSVFLLALLFTTMDPSGTLRWPILSGVLIGLLLLCRLDYTVLLAPWVLWSAWSLRSDWRRIARFGAGAIVPVALWSTITIWYYSFLLPSTFTAKTNSTIPHADLVARGLDYIRLSLGHDPALLALAVVVLALVVINRDTPLVVWGIGSTIYLTYVVWVGGDYMMGRFLHAPAMAVLLAITQTQLPRTERLSRASVRLLYAIPLAITLVAAPAALSLRLTPTQLTLEEHFAPIVNERADWVSLGRGLDPLGSTQTAPGIIQSDLRFLDTQARAWPDQVPIGAQPVDSVLVRCGGLGAIGFLRPDAFIIDQCGLTDRFMASLSYSPSPDGWKAGHFDRQPPPGYVEAVEQANPDLVQDMELRKRLKELWAKIRHGQ